MDYLKKVIAFALWGNKQMYIYGAFRNIKLAAYYYPDYICRFYVDADMNKEVIGRLMDRGAEVIQVMGSERSCRLWRLRVIADETVERFLIRDVDSRIGKREWQAVRLWEKSDKILHIMRDHVKHTAPIMGGMWGAKRKELVELTDFIKKYDDYVDRIDNGYTPSTRLGHSPLGDQNFLKYKVYNKTKGEEMVHTSTSKKRPTDSAFPSKIEKDRKLHFIGQVYDHTNRPKYDLKGNVIKRK